MNYVVGFMFSPDYTSVILIKKARPSWQAGKYDGVGGKIEKDELPHDAMVREFGEETGIYAPRWNKFCTLSSPNFPDDSDLWNIHFFYTTGSVGEAKSVTDEEIMIFSCGSLPDNLIPNIKWLLPMALTDKPYDCKYTITEVYG